MGSYSVGGHAPSNGAMWNPHSSTRVTLTGIDMAVTATPGIDVVLGIRRCSTRGTPTVTVTPDIDNSWEQHLAPPAGPLIDLQYSVLPTLDTSVLARVLVPSLVSGVGTGFDQYFNFPGIALPPGTGVVFGDLADTTPVSSDWTFYWRDGGG